MRARWFGLAVFGLASAAPAMPVSTFLAKADALKSRGPLALLSSDYGLLKKEVTDSIAALRQERLAAVQAGRAPAYCPTQASGPMSVDEIMGAMNAVPPAARAHTEVKDAMRAHMAQRFPCKA